MCRYAFGHYKPHFACFACRKAFKRRNREDVDPTGDEHPARCPECGGLMAEMGLDFQAPPQSKRRAWRVLETLWEVGETFHSCGCGGPGYRPRDPAALRVFLRDILAGYRQHLAAWQAETEPRLAANRRDAIATWSARITRAEAALRRLEEGRASSRYEVGDLVRVLERPVSTALEQEAPEVAAHHRWQMGRVFRVTQVSPGGHVGLEACDVEGNVPPVDLPVFLHPTFVAPVLH